MTSTTASVPPPPLRGRDEERGALGNALAALRAGRGCVVVVEGAAGIGKTRLLDEAVAIGRRLDARIGRATAAAGHRVVPMAALLTAVSAGSPPLLDAGEMPRLDAAARDLRYWLIEELESGLERRATTDRLVIVIDDLQWADGSTVAAIEALSARLAELPIAWVVALRADEASEELVSALERMTVTGAVRIPLAPLDVTAVLEVVTDLSGAPPDAAMGMLADTARGVPFWLVELLIALKEAGRIEHIGGHASVRDGELPSRIWEATRNRLNRMTPEARELASVASILGRRFTFASLQRMLDAPATRLLSPVDELLRSGVLVEDGQYLAFRHDLLREGILAALPASARLALERQAADVLLASGAPPVEVALRLADAARPGDAEAIRILLRAVHALGGSDPEAAAELARRTLELMPRDDPQRAPLVAETAILLHAAGRADEAVHFADTALRQLLSPAEESEVRLSISGMFSLSADERAAANRQALALDGLTPRDRAPHQARLIHNVLAAGRWNEVRRLRAELGDEIRAHGDEATRYVLIGAEAGMLYGEARFTEANALIETAARIAADEGDDARLTIAEQWRSETLGALDRLQEAMALSAQGLARAQRESQAWAIHLWEQWRGRELSHLGHYQDAIAMLEASFRPGEVRPSFGANDASALTALTRAALHIGDRRNLQRCEEIALRALAGGTPELRRHAGWVLAQQAMATGDPTRAHAYLTELAGSVDDDEPILPSLPMDPTDQPHMVRIALAAGDVALARRSVSLAEYRAAMNPDVASIVGAARHARGLLDGDAGALEEAVAAYERGPRRPALASALEDAAVVALGDHERSVSLLNRALELTNEMDARWDSHRLRRRLRGLGVRRRMVTAARPTVGWEALTASELAVVRAITGGMTNRETAEALFLSPHTVGSHLRHVFAKLSINSRVELARMAGEHAQ